jgi:hypothetical protein
LAATPRSSKPSHYGGEATIKTVALRRRGERSPKTLPKVLCPVNPVHHMATNASRERSAATSFFGGDPDLNPAYVTSAGTSRKPPPRGTAVVVLIWADDYGLTETNGRGKAPWRDNAPFTLD